MMKNKDPWTAPTYILNINYFDKYVIKFHTYYSIFQAAT